MIPKEEKKETVLPPNPYDAAGPDPPTIRRGTQAQVPFKMGIIGGGKACDDLLTLLIEEHFSPLNIEILGVADPDPQAPGVVHAGQLGIFTTSDFMQLYTLPDLNFLIELTGSRQVRDQVIKTKPFEVSFMDFQGARLIWDLLQKEAEKYQLELEERALEEEVRQHKEYLENILIHSSDMIITTDLQGRIVTFNPGGERMLGYSKEEVQGQTIEKIWKNPEDRKRLMKEVRSQGAVNNFQATLIDKNGRPVEISLSLSLLRNRNGQILGTVGISKDVTEENRLRQQLIESERLAAIGQTVAGLTHCIKNILNGLKGGSYLIDIGLKRKQNDLVEEGWTTVQKGISRIQNLSLDMLTYCRPRVPEYQSADPLQLALETVALVSQGALQEGIDLQVSGPEGLLADLDPIQIGRALLNLITNALDACRERDYSEGEKPFVQVIVEMAGDRLKILIRDNGLGMGEEVKAQLFKRFFSTKESGGTGLGLSVSEKIISEHGGTLEVDSTPGRGTTFTILLPVSTCQELTGTTSKQ